MPRYSLALALALSAAAAAAAARAAETPPLCKALHGLADAARSSHTPQRISLLAGTDAASMCRRTTPGAATAEFCAAAAGSDVHVTAWLVDECLQTVTADPQVTTGAEASGFKGRKRITRLAAKLGGGVRLDLSAPGASYDLVVWKAD